MNYLRILTTVLIALILSTAGWTQTVVKGKIVDASNETLPHANVLVLDKQDSSLVMGGITNMEGDFHLNFKTDQPVFLAVRFVGSQDYNVDLPNHHTSIDLGAVVLNERSQSLGEITVSAKRALFERKIDRTVINIQSSVTSAGNTALNVLSKSPAITINRANGEIGLMGKQGVLVTINDKPVRMEPADLLNLLEGMPAENIENIELITTPPASYDAQGTAGIININMVEESNNGIVGRTSVNVAYGADPKYGGTMNLNYKKGKLQAYTNLSVNVDHAVQIVTLKTDYQYPANQVVSDMYSHRDTRLGLYTGEAGINYEIGTKTNVGAMFNIYNRDYTMDAIADTDIHSDTQGHYNQFIESDETNNMFRTLYNTNVEHTFSEAAKLNFDYDYINFLRDNPTNYSVTDTDETNGEQTQEDFRSSAETPLNIHVFKTDLELKRNDKLKIETGAKVSFSGFENDVTVANKRGATFTDDPTFTQIYKMDEKVYAGYASVDWQFRPSWMLKGGLRYEHYQLYLSSDEQGKIIDDQEDDLFPSVFLNYKQSDHHEWNLSYVRRIQRPGFMQLAPYFYFFNKNVLFTGNPHLTPANSSQFQLSFRYKIATINAEYAYTDKPIYFWQPATDLEREIVILAPSQGKESQIASLAFSIPWHITKQWSSNYHLMGYHRIQTPIILNQALKQRSNDFVFNMNHTYEVAENWNFELNARYKSPHYEGIAKVAANANVDVGLQHQFKNGIALTVNATDLFNTSSEFPVIGDATDQGMYHDFKYNVEGPVFRFNISIPLGNKNVKERKNRVTGSVEEQQRL